MTGRQACVLENLNIIIESSSAGNSGWRVLEGQKAKMYKYYLRETTSRRRKRRHCPKTTKVIVKVQ